MHVPWEYYLFNEHIFSFYILLKICTKLKPSSQRPLSTQTFSWWKKGRTSSVLTQRWVSMTTDLTGSGRKKFENSRTKAKQSWLQRLKSRSSIFKSELLFWRTPKNADFLRHQRGKKCVAGSIVPKYNSPINRDNTENSVLMSYSELKTNRFKLNVRPSENSN